VNPLRPSVTSAGQSFFSLLLCFVPFVTLNEDVVPTGKETVGTQRGSTYTVRIFGIQ
jgi:hypothetical protein